jgi:hypothetical protein
MKMIATTYDRLETFGGSARQIRHLAAFYGDRQWMAKLNNLGIPQRV